MASRLIALILLSVLAACGSGTEGSPAVASPESGTATGRLLSLACQACHSLNEDGPQLLGPNLYGVFGRAAAQDAGYSMYSEALRNSGIVWSAAELDAWLADPAGYLPGTTMGFSGYQSAADRAALIEYLMEATGDNSSLDQN